MRYTERKFDTNFSSPYDFIRMVFVLIFIAPARLCFEISSKVIFLKKQQIMQILNVAFIIMLSIIVCTNFMLFIGGSFSLTTSKFPLVMQLVALVLLTLLNFIFSTIDLVIYKQLDSLLPIITGVELNTSVGEDSTKSASSSSESSTVDTVEVNEETIEETPDEIKADILGDLNLSSLDSMQKEAPMKEPVEEQVKEVNQEVSTASKSKDLDLDSYDLESLLNESIADNDDIKSYQNSNEDIVNELLSAGFSTSSNLSAEEIKTIENNLDESTNPSKYLDEAILNMFSGKINVDNFGTIETFNNWGIPSNFNMLT